MRDKVLLWTMLVFVQFGCTAVQPASYSEILPGPATTPQSSPTCNGITFRFVIVSQQAMSDKIFKIEVFLDPKSFSENNLRSLFEYLSSTKDDSVTLLINVETDWNRIRIPNGCIGGDSSLPFDPSENSFHRAIYRREAGKASFRFNPVLNTNKFVRVNM